MFGDHKEFWLPVLLIISLSVYLMDFIVTSESDEYVIAHNLSCLCQVRILIEPVVLCSDTNLCLSAR
jgi:hypothetical protein